jgi:hypothetical protein
MEPAAPSRVDARPLPGVVLRLVHDVYALVVGAVGRDPVALDQTRPHRLPSGQHLEGEYPDLAEDAVQGLARQK